MASRKRKSISSRPTTQYDTRRFHSLDAWNRYMDNVFGRNILPERKVEIYHTELDDFKTELERCNFHKHFTNLVDGIIDLALLKEFYANLFSSESPSPKQVRVRGQRVKIDADSLNIFLETPVVLEEDYREIEAALCIPGRGFILNAEGHPRKILRKDLTTLAQVWSILSYSNLASTSHTSDMIVDRARLIFDLVSHMDMNVVALISSQITSIAQSNSSRLGFPALITALCRARGVVSDSLVFERLSSIINLAYIRKNCWNPDDLTVTIRGARRARPAELPSTYVVPTPASSSAATSVPAHTDSQRFEAMLQSIHQGQIILLQSLQVVAPPGSIPSVEQFREMVAWPGTQPSLHREDEGPTAQVPQHVEDESSEATIPEPFIIGEEAATSTLERSLEATSEPPTPVMDISSPQHAADPSTPILEIPEDLTTPVLNLNTSPLATLVLHLIDEEDVQEKVKADMEAMKEKMATMMEAMMSMKKIMEVNAVTIAATSIVAKVNPTSPFDINQMNHPTSNMVCKDLGSTGGPHDVQIQDEHAFPPYGLPLNYTPPNVAYTPNENVNNTTPILVESQQPQSDHAHVS
ncbi:hypothetical protein GmHk_17G049558 [Glycine max]|nr:hypothetical protein GmHk_17G049558 [Glycine max]